MLRGATGPALHGKSAGMGVVTWSYLKSLIERVKLQIFRVVGHLELVQYHFCCTKFLYFAVLEYKHESDLL